jgi:hypothetical protein
MKPGLPSGWIGGSVSSYPGHQKASSDAVA